jgi:uncharacterized membrane protein
VVRLLNIWDSLRGSFWFLPALLTTAAIGLAAGLLTLDHRAGSDELATSLWLYAGGAEGARSLLSAVAGSIITVVGLAFSITIVSLQLAAAQLGPRLLRNFVRDRGNQVVLGTFVATFVYCLVVLRTVRGRDGVSDDRFVPHLAISGAVLLALLSVALLIYFIHHASTSMQADRVIAAVAVDLDDAIDALFPERLGREAPGDRPPAPPRDGDDGAPVAARGHGYVTSVDGEALLKTASEADVLIRLLRRPGEFAIVGEPIARVVPGDRLDDDLARAITRAVLVGPERTFIQDVFFGFEQLVEIAQRALASNHIDPTTALRCIDRLAAAIARVSDRRLPSPYRRDAEGIVRVVAPAPVLRDFVGAAFTAIRLAGVDNRGVALHLLDSFERLAALRDRRELHLALLGEAVAIRRAAARTFRDPGDREGVYAAFERLLKAIRPDVRRIYDAQAVA